MISAFAGTSKSTVLHFTIFIPDFLVIPANKYLSRPSGTGAIAEKTVAGSAPMIIATSVLPLFI